MLGPAWSNELTVFAFQASQDVTFDVRVVVINGDPWFVAKDVCIALGLKGYPSKYTDGMNEAQRQTLTRGTAGLTGECLRSVFSAATPQVTVLSEAALYCLIMRSDKASARPFQDWVTGTVLPSIRKHGGYVMNQEKVVAGEMSDHLFSGAPVEYYHEYNADNKRISLELPQ